MGIRYNTPPEGYTDVDLDKVIQLALDLSEAPKKILGEPSDLVAYRSGVKKADALIERAKPYLGVSAVRSLVEDFVFAVNTHRIITIDYYKTLGIPPHELLQEVYNPNTK